MKIIFDSEEQKDSYIRYNCCADFVDVKERCRQGDDIEECKECFEKYIEMEVEHGTINRTARRSCRDKR